MKAENTIGFTIILDILLYFLFPYVSLCLPLSCITVDYFTFHLFCFRNKESNFMRYSNIIALKQNET